MYETLEGLDTDEIELNMKTSPPSILNNVQQQKHQKEVQDLKQGTYIIKNVRWIIKTKMANFQENLKKFPKSSCNSNRKFILSWSCFSFSFIHIF